jgi:hypothetical protein
MMLTGLKCLESVDLIGLSDRNRTCDPQLRRLLLYPTELRTEMKKGLAKRGLFYFYGRGDRIRTYDPLVPNQMRYQAALRPDSNIVTRKWLLLSWRPNEKSKPCVDSQLTCEN